MADPYYSIDGVDLYLGDCRQIDAWLTADVLITDPPYGRRWKQGAQLTNAAGAGSSSRNVGIANDADTSARDEALRMWTGDRAIVFGDLMLAPPAGTRQVLVYHKPGDAGVRGAIAGHRRDAEAVYLLGHGWPAQIGGRSSILETHANVIAGPAGPAARYGHPHAKPVDLMAYLVGLAGDVIADPFAGSGSTLVAARDLGCRAIGVELDERHCETIARRLDQLVLAL